MTVIFHTNARMPALAGDMLLSVPGPNSHTNLRLPSQPGGVIVPSDQMPRYIPITMRRKITIVNKHMAVGVAGSALHAGMFIEDLTERFNDRNTFTHADINDFLGQYAFSPRGSEVLEQSGVLILAEASDWRGSLTKGLTDHTNMISSQFGRVMAIGSGSDAIIEQVSKFDNGYRFGMSQPSEGESRFPEFVTLSRNLMLLANLYWREFSNPVSVFDAWGGAYDLIYQDSNREFQYLTDYSIIIRLFDADKIEQGIHLMNVLKYERRPDVSFVTMLNGDKLDFFGAKDIASGNESIQVTLNSGDLTMNSKMHISIIAVGKGSQFLPPMIQIDGLDDSEETKQTVFTWFDENGRLNVAFHAEHDQWLEEQAISYYQQNAARF